jgi:predicted RND superfamily exporter protein
MQEIKKRFKVRTFSLVEGLNEGLKKNKNKSILDITDYNEVGEAILAVSGGRTVMDLLKVSSHLLSHPEAIDFYTKFRIAATMSGIAAAGPSKLSFEVPYVKAIQAFGQLDPSYPLEKQRFVLADIRNLAESYSTPEIKFYTFATDLASHDVDQKTGKNVFLMALILILVDIFFLWGEFRSRKEIFLVLFILLTSLIWTFGITALIGMRLMFLHLITIPILLGVGIDNSFVFGRRLVEEQEKGKGFAEAIRSTFDGTGLGIFLATVTTLIAFLSSAFTSGGAKAIVSFNLLIALSMAVCLVLTILLQGAIRAEVEKGTWRSILSMMSPPLCKLARRFCGGGRMGGVDTDLPPLSPPYKGGETGEAKASPTLQIPPVPPFAKGGVGGFWGLLSGVYHELCRMARNDKVKAILDKTYFHLNKITSGFASFGSRCITKRPRMIFFISAVIIIAALFSSSRIGTEFDYKMLMRKNMPTYIVDRLQEKYFGRSRVGYLLIEGDVENPLLLEKMRLLQKRMGEYPDVEKILGVANVDSINDLIDKMQYSLPPKASPKEIFDIISESDKTANYVLDESYKDVASHLLRKRGDHYDGLLMKFYLTSSDAKKTQAFCNKINKDMKELKFDEIPGIHTKIGGGIIGFHVEE